MKKSLIASIATAIVLLLSIYIDDVNYNKLKAVIDNKNNVLGSQSVNTNEDNIKVVKITDGDTVVLENGYKIRLIGIDAPELSHNGNKAECYSNESTDKLSNLILNKYVKLEKDRTDEDRYKRKLRYIYLDNTLINEVMVKDGFAKSYPYPPDVKYQDQIELAQKSAKSNSIGMWSNLCKRN